MNLLRLIRYRFFLFAGLLPFFLGQMIAFGTEGGFDWKIFSLGLLGIFFVLTAVELFNEYFDAKVGGDRIFSQEEVNIPNWFWTLGVAALAGGFVIGLYLASLTGWWVLFFSFFGFMGAYFYVGPPIRWAYRGFGETVIGLCYGPFMVLGSYYIQTGKIAFVPFYVSLICGLSVFCLAILNEIPDYYQDMLVGKRNLVVRLGKERALVLLKSGLTAVFAMLIAGIVFKMISLPALMALVTVPWILISFKRVGKNLDDPGLFRLAVNTIVISHVVIAVSLGLSFLV